MVVASQKTKGRRRNIYARIDAGHLEVVFPRLSINHSMQWPLYLLTFVMGETAKTRRPRKFLGMRGDRILFSISHAKKTYAFRHPLLQIETIKIEDGSIKINLTLVWIFVGSAYAGVTSYPDFREGLSVLKDDIAVISNFFSTASDSDWGKAYLKCNKIPSPTVKGPEISTDIISEDEFLKQLTNAIENREN